MSMSILERISGGQSELVSSEFRQEVIRNFHRDNEIQSSDQNGDINPLDHVRLHDHVVIPSSLPNAISRQFVFRITDSMEHLACEPRNLLCAPLSSDIFKTHSRYSPTADYRTPDLKGDLDQMVILGAKIISYHSDMPVPLNVSFVDGDEQRDFNAFRGNYRDVTSGKRMHFSIPPKAICGNVNKAINTTSPFIHSSYLSKYQGLISKESLKNNGIYRYGDISMVTIDHPIVNTLIASQDEFQIDVSSMKKGVSPPDLNNITHDILYIPNDVVDLCIDILGDDLQANLPLINLAGLRMKISRPDVSDNQFDTKNGMVFEPELARCEKILNAEGGGPKYTQKNVPRHVEVTAEITYAYL